MMVGAGPHKKDLPHVHQHSIGGEKEVRQGKDSGLVHIDNGLVYIDRLSGGCGLPGRVYREGPGQNAHGVRRTVPRSSMAADVLALFNLLSEFCKGHVVQVAKDGPPVRPLVLSRYLVLRSTV